MVLYPTVRIQVKVWLLVILMNLFYSILLLQNSRLVGK